MIQLKIDVYCLGWYGQQVGSKGQCNDIPVLQVPVLQDSPMSANLNINLKGKENECLLFFLMMKILLM